MERKIGETFEFEGKKLQVKESEEGSCNFCFFNEECKNRNLHVSGACDGAWRDDKKNVIFVEVQEQPQPQKLNLCEVLKNCPKSTILWSDNYGEVRFLRINIKCETPIEVKRTDGCIAYYTKEGWHSIRFPANCLLWPSRDCRDWSKFTAPWYKKEKLVELKENDDEKMRNFIINELVCLRATDEKGSDRYEGLTNAITWLEKQEEQNLLSTNERAWLYLISDVLTWKDGIGQYLDDSNVQELAKKLCNKYAQKLYNPSVFSNSSNNGR